MTSLGPRSKEQDPARGSVVRPQWTEIPVPAFVETEPIVHRF